MLKQVPLLTELILVSRCPSINIPSLTGRLGLLECPDLSALFQLYMATESGDKSPHSKHFIAPRSYKR